MIRKLSNTCENSSCDFSEYCCGTKISEDGPKTPWYLQYSLKFFHRSFADIAII